MVVTREQKALLDAAARVLAADPEIEAAWLAGSLGHGAGDAFSDVDIVALVEEGRAPAIGQRYGDDVAAIAEPALVTPLFGGRILSVVTVDWARFDISFVEPGSLDRYDAAAFTPLFNRGARTPPTKPASAYHATPQSMLPLVTEFLRVLGLFPVAVGRGEWLLALAGINILRQLTIDLMLEENGVGPSERGGALRRNPFLTPEQRAALEGLSPLAANRDAAFRANAEIAAVFLPRARALAARIGADWPARFEEATRRHLKTRLGFELP